ncbi:MULTISPECIES: helix-turn-helix domain-containing protein [unclassified Massilia]|uniref:helix-turn-helix domain-containing protein n=1 Tax=unclassified Massilia TaxID=2609279 RepID=UPI0009EC3896|nr:MULTISPECIES: helix-turn-helix transcriptional regulator [unclassified Massilia]
MSKNKSTSSLRARFAHNIRVCRVQKGLSQEQLAALAGFSRTFVSDVERQVRNCSIDNIERLAEALEIDVSEFFLPVREDSESPTNLPKGPRNRRSE